jgi:hypothetical protein
MGKLYAVTAGDYDYYEILALCTNKNKAHEIAQMLVKERYSDIVKVEEYENADNCETDVYKVAHLTEIIK